MVSKMVAKLRMPAKKGPDPMLLMDDSAEGSDAEEAAESPEEESAEGADGAVESAGPDLASVPDDDLVKEMEARGFSVKAPASEK